MYEQLSVISIKVVFNSSIFSDDLTKGCCVEGKQEDLRQNLGGVRTSV